MIDGEMTAEEDLGPIREIMAEIRPLSLEETAQAIFHLRDSAASADRNLDRLTLAVRKAEEERDEARGETRRVERERDGSQRASQHRIDELEQRLRNQIEATAEMRGRLREARANQMVRRGDALGDDLNTDMGGVPF